MNRTNIEVLQHKNTKLLYLKYYHLKEFIDRNSEAFEYPWNIKQFHNFLVGDENVHNIRVHFKKKND